MQMPGGVPGGGMVRVGIERDIIWAYMVILVYLLCSLLKRFKLKIRFIRSEILSGIEDFFDDF